MVDLVRLIVFFCSAYRLNLTSNGQSSKQPMLRGACPLAVQGHAADAGRTQDKPLSDSSAGPQLHITTCREGSERTWYSVQRDDLLVGRSLASHVCRLLARHVTRQSLKPEVMERSPGRLAARNAFVLPQS
jgi:hypothetical protein